MSGWQRLGVVICVLWPLYWAAYLYMEQTEGPTCTMSFASDRVKMKNADAPAVKREEEEEWAEANGGGKNPRNAIAPILSATGQPESQRWSFPYCRSRRASYSPQAT